MFHLSARSRARHPALPYFCHCCLPVPPRCPLGGWTGQWTCAPLALASITLFAAFTHLLAQCKLGRHPLLHELLFGQLIQAAGACLVSLGMICTFSPGVVREYWLAQLSKNLPDSNFNFNFLFLFSKVKKKNQAAVSCLGYSGCTQPLWYIPHFIGKVSESAGSSCSFLWVQKCPVHTAGTS